MIQTRDILDIFEFFEKDLPAVKALWATLHTQTVDGSDKNCWPAVPDDRWFAHLRKHCHWAVVEDEATVKGFTFWRLDPDGNAFVRAIAALDEAAYLRLVIASVSASTAYAYGQLQRGRPERTWFENIGATFEPVGFAPLTPANEERIEKEVRETKQVRHRQKSTNAVMNREIKKTIRAKKLAARVSLIDKVIVPVSLLPKIEARLEELG